MDPVLVEQRLLDLEHVCRGLSHEANNWLYAVLGQTEMAEHQLRQMAVALRYADRMLGRLEQQGMPAGLDLPAAAIAELRQKLPRKTMRRRLDGLRKARRNAQQLAGAMQRLHQFASGRESLGGTVDLNAAARAAVELLQYGYYRYQESWPRIELELGDGLPPVAGSAGLVMGIIVDLAAGATGERVRIATRSDGGTVVCEVQLSGGDAAGMAAARAAAQLCGGQLTVERTSAGATCTVRLLEAGALQALRSGSA